MTKFMRRLVAFVLTVIMCFSMGTTAFATGTLQEANASEIIKMPDGSYVLYDASSNITVKGYDLPNGDCVFEQYVGAELSSKYSVNRNQGVILATYVDSGTIVNETIPIPTSITTSNNSTRDTSGGYLGQVKYRYTSGDASGICGAKVSYTKNTGSKKYNVNGTYQDLASLASTIATFLSVPVALAMSSAKALFTILGLSLAATTVLIPDKMLNSNYVEIEYDLTDINNHLHTNSFFGTRYTITESSNQINKEYTEGTYYPTSSWGNTNFGTTIYNHMFGYSTWSIYSWS